MDLVTVAIKAWLAIKPVKRIKEKRKAKRAKKSGIPEPEKEIEVNVLIQGLKSKTVLFGILSSVWGLVQVYIGAGVFTREATISLLSGIVIIVLRAVTTQPLSAK